MSRRLIGVVAALLVVFPLAATSQTPAPRAVTNQAKVPQAVASIVQAEAARQQAINHAMAPIKSRADLDAYLQAHAVSGSPLDALSAAARQRFLQNLVFTDLGLGSFYYGDLQQELTPTQAYRILALFGVQQDIRMVDPVHRSTELDALIMRAPARDPS